MLILRFEPRDHLKSLNARLFWGRTLPQFPVQTCNNQNGVLNTVLKCNSTKHRFTYPEPHTKHKMVTRLPPPSLGSYSLSNDNSHCFENVTIKVNLRCLNLIALIPSRSIRQMLANFLWSWILKDCIKVQKRKRKSLPCVHVRYKSWN